MALVIGTNCGFVAIAPSADPSAPSAIIDYYARATKFTSPAGSNKVTEMGWYLTNTPGDPGESWQLGIYNDDGGQPGDLLLMATDIIGESPGWQVASGLDFSLSASTGYWLAVVQAASTPDTTCAYKATGAEDYSIQINRQTLADPWVQDSFGVYVMGVYAKYEVAATYVELAGASGTTSGAAGALGVTTILVGSSATTSGATGNLNGIKLEGLVSATPGMSGSLSLQKELVGVSATTSGGDGWINIATTLFGSSAATSDASGTLYGSPLAGSSATTSGGDGSLSVDKHIAGTNAATSGASGSLSRQKELAGASAATSGGDSSLSVLTSLGRASIVEISGTSGAVGGIGIVLTLVGSISATSGVSAVELGRYKSIVGSVAEVSGTSGFLNGVPVSGVSDAVPGADGSLNVQPQFEGSVVATSSAVVVIGISPYLIGEPMFWRPHDGIDETLEWKTNILTARKGTEQRIKGRQAARQFFAMTLYLDTDKKNAWYNSILHSNQKSAWYVPVWTEYAEFTGDIAKGDTAITVDTKYADFRANSFAIIWKSDSEWEIVSVLSKNDSSLTLDYSILNSYADSCLIMPVRRCYLTHPAARTRNTAPVAKVRLVFSVWDNEDITGYNRSDLWNTLVNGPAFEDCVDILDTPAFMGRTHTENSSANVTVLDYQTGIFQLKSKSDFNRLIQDHKFYNDTKQACWEFRQYLCAMGGRQKMSLIPTFRDDLVQDSDIEPGDTKVNVENIAVDDAGVNDMRKYIGFYFESTDTLIVRSITGTAWLDAAIEQVTFDRSLGLSTVVEPGDCRICFIDKCRFSSDKVVLRWEFSHRNECKLNFLRVT